ncbi:hypothetical protein [Rubrolithibacter danxiaensis]|uniref:hypothetical protein n=1 Tax=Rubrolithibacter danxiaensis TaxID=3390805 RepID=UPI003BF83ADC
MKKNLISIPLLLLFLVTGCSTVSKDGTYLIYKVETDSPGNMGGEKYNDKISKFLQSKLQGKKFQLTFTDKFATAKDVEDTETYVLAKEESSDSNTSSDYYSASFEKPSQEKFHLTLSELEDDVQLRVVLTTYTTMDTTAAIDEPVRTEMWGAVECHLSKLPN